MGLDLHEKEMIHKVREVQENIHCGSHAMSRVGQEAVVKADGLLDVLQAYIARYGIIDEAREWKENEDEL